MHKSEKAEKVILEIVDSLVEESEILPLIRSKEEIAKIITERVFSASFKNLEISIGLDDEYTCLLKGSANIEGFSGYGEGWFNISEVEGFIESLSKRELPLELAGGYYGNDHKLKHKNFSLKISEISSNWKYSIAIVLQNFPEAGFRVESIMKFSSELIVGKQELDSIIENFSGMVKGNQQCFVITGQ